MTRTKGSRNFGFDERRLALADRLRSRLAEREGGRPSLGELARSAGVSVATLRHYFGDRDGVVAAVLALHAPFGHPHLERLAAPQGPFADSVREAADWMAAGLDTAVVEELHLVGLSEGLDGSSAGPDYLAHTLEPMIEALEARFAAHIGRGEMRSCDTRAAALGLASPLLIAHLHQRALGGAGFRPLDRDAHRRAQVEAFVRAYSACIA